MSLRSAVMKLLIGAIAYLSFVAAVVATVFAGVASIERRPPKEAPVLAMATDDDRAARRARAIEEVEVDPNRVPVWIVPTAKYEYTPVAVAPRPKQPPVTDKIDKDARGAMAKARNPRRKPELATEAGPPPGGAYSRRDNDPFFRD
jgi:hypothetical protein